MSEGLHELHRALGRLEAQTAAVLERLEELATGAADRETRLRRLEAMAAKAGSLAAAIGAAVGFAANLLAAKLGEWL